MAVAGYCQGRIVRIAYYAPLVFPSERTDKYSRHSLVYEWRRDYGFPLALCFQGIASTSESFSLRFMQLVSKWGKWSEIVQPEIAIRCGGLIAFLR